MMIIIFGLSSPFMFCTISHVVVSAPGKICSLIVAILAEMSEAGFPLAHEAWHFVG